MGLYDANGDGFTDQLILAEGETQTHVNVSIALIQPITARTRFSQIQSISSNWTSDAVLMAVESHLVSPQGKSTYWLYIFYSQTLSAYFVILACNVLMAPFTQWEETPTYTTAIPPNWMDSDVVMDSAESHGGASFKLAHPDAEIKASLSVFPIGSDEMNTPVWSIQYQSSTSLPKEFLVNAVTGTLITGVEGRKVSETVPLTYMLGQNYPSPFNPITIIPYVVKTSGRVKITVHDLEGRRIETVVDGFHTPGAYQARVDGKHWASGVYFYRIQVNGFEAVRKMLLMR